MNVGLPEVKQDFASIVERITLQPWTMLQFIIWLDLKLAEYKVNGYMVLDQSLSSIPDWLASLNIDKPEDNNSPSESIKLQEQYMQPTNTSWRDSSVQSNTYRRELSAQLNISRRDVRPQRAFVDRRRDTVAGNQPIPSRNQPVPARNQPVPARNQPIPGRNQPLPARNQPVPARNQPLPARNQPLPARNQPVPTRNDAIGPRQFPSASPQERPAAGFQRSASPITIDDEEVTVPEHNPALPQGQRTVMKPDGPGMKRGAMQQPPNAPRHVTDIKHRKVTDTSSPARSPSSANIPCRDFDSDNNQNIEETPSSEGVLSRTVNRPSPSAAQSPPTQPVQSEQQPQSDIGTVSCDDTTLQDSSLSLDIKPVVSETLDDIISPEATGQPQPDSAPLEDINFEMPEFLPAQSFGDELFDPTSSEPVPTQLFVNTVESRKPATATSTSATGSDSSSNQPDPVAGTSYGTRSQLDIDFDDSGDAQVKMEPGEAEPDDTEPYGFNVEKAIKSSPSHSIEEDLQKMESHINMEQEVVPFMAPFTIDKKHWRFAPNTRRDIALYAIIHGNTNAARKFTAELGRVVGESTVRQMKNAYLKLQLRQ